MRQATQTLQLIQINDQKKNSFYGLRLSKDDDVNAVDKNQKILAWFWGVRKKEK